MCVRTVVRIILAAGLAALAAGARASEPARVMHSPATVAPASTPLAVEATIVGDLPPERVATAELAVLTPDGELRILPMSVSRRTILGEIPGTIVRPPRIRYYMRVERTDGETFTSPAGAPEAGLFEVPVGRDDEPGKARAWHTDSIDIVCPLPGEVTESASPYIAAAFDPPLEEPWEALVALDGEDVTDAADVTATAMVLVPELPLERGPHRATLSVLTPTGTAEVSWVFFVGEMSAPDTGEGLHAAEEVIPGGWSVGGRVEVGWASVIADTVEADSLDVYLPYEEVSRPTLDFYASGLRGDRSFLVTARYSPVYDSELDWLVETRGRNLDVQAGTIFPSLSRTTLDWASGHGVDLTARFGDATAKLVAMRMSPADTAGGFGIYSRFAAGASGSYEWSENMSTQLVYVAVFDREESVPEEQRLTDPLENHVAAALLRGTAGRFRSELEIAGSSTSGDYEGEGYAVRAVAGVEKDLDNRVSLEYVRSSEDHYSGGTFETEAGESALELDFSFRPHDRLRTSGWARIGDPAESQDTVGEDEYELRLYGRAELTGEVRGDDVRTYAVGRYDRTPYDAYDYVYWYGALGGSWRGRATRVALSLSRSRSHSSETVDTWSGSIDARRTLISDRWRLRLAGRWTSAEGTEDTDYLRSHYTLESRWTVGELDIDAEYWFVKRDDAAEPQQTYTEHVLLLSVGTSF